MSNLAIDKRSWIASKRKSDDDTFMNSVEAGSLHAGNCSPRLWTDRLHQLVPLMKFVGAEVKVISPEETKISTPLLQSARNQNGTHQASVFYIMADYTLGIALFSAVPWVYLIDIHDRCACLPVQMWLLSGQVKHIAPGTGEIVAVAGLSAEEQDRARRDFVRKQRCRVTGKVSFYQDGKLVALAEHEVGMYAITTQ